MRLNQASQQELANIQSRAGVPVGERPRHQAHMRKRIDQQRRIAQRLLQERQRRELVLLKHRNRAPYRGSRPLVNPAVQQRQFKLQQQTQLRRFMTQ